MFPSPHLGGRLGELRRSSLWWKKVSLLGAKEGSRSDWFADVVVLKVRNNITASFWFDPWVEGSSFTARVVDMGYWVGDKWEWDFRWKREMLMGELVLLKKFVLVVEGKVTMNSFDAWSWNLDINGVCSVKLAYGHLSSVLPDGSSKNQLLDIALTRMWMSKALSKMATFSWQLLQDRLPIHHNLFRRRIIVDPGSTVCAFCGVVKKSMEIHKF
jgi:hypothetical protein